MWTLFEFGSIGFWILDVVVLLLLMACVEFERSFVALLLVVATLVLWNFCGNRDLFPWMAAHAGHLAVWAIVYVVIGVVWSLVRWALYVADAREELLEYKRAWETTHGDFGCSYYENGEKKVTTDFWVWWRLGGDDARMARRNHAIPQPQDFKGRIISWMAYWPISMLNSLLFDFLRRFFSHLYNALAGTFRRISRAVYGDLADKLEIRS